MNEPQPVYRDQVLAVEPTGIEPVLPEQRHGNPRDLFGIWFSANAEIATWMVGIFIVALYGTDLRSALIGIVLGNCAGFAVLGVLATLGPRYGVPQMVASRFALGRIANIAPATLSFLAGVGWFAINTIFGSYALETLAHIGYPLALAFMLVLQIIIAVYGYNLLARFEHISAILLAAGFLTLGVVTFSRVDWSTPFHALAPIASGGPIAGFIFATALSFSYALGWVPCASDYSRYLPAATSRKAVFWYSLAGTAIPCIALQIMGAATVTLTKADLSASIPTDAIAALLGPHGIVAGLVLASIVLGTITANCMNLYSGALAGLVAFNIRIPRWSAALGVGVIGAILALAGANPRDTADSYANFLLLLSYWASPWAGVILVNAFMHKQADREKPQAFRRGAAAWILGLLASVPFWNQTWFIGPMPRAFPHIGDLSYYVGFLVAALLTFTFERIRTKTSLIDPT